ncbi:MAG: hypothetical protein ACK5JS_05965 [Mangrovibacterium sp.]
MVENILVSESWVIPEIERLGLYLKTKNHEIERMEYDFLML